MLVCARVLAMRSSRSKQDEEESFLSARDQHVEDGEGDLSDGMRNIKA